MIGELGPEPIQPDSDERKDLLSGDEPPGTVGRTASERPVTGTACQCAIPQKPLRVQRQGIGTKSLLVEVQLPVGDQDFHAGSQVATADDGVRHHGPDRRRRIGHPDDFVEESVQTRTRV